MKLLTSITTKQALLIAAAAVVAHPFISKAVAGWGVYPTSNDAYAACERWEKAGGKYLYGRAWGVDSAAIRWCQIDPQEKVVKGFIRPGVSKNQRVKERVNTSEIAKHWKF